MSAEEAQAKVEQAAEPVVEQTEQTETEASKGTPLASIKSAVENVNGKIVEGAKAVEAEAKVAGDKIAEVTKKSSNPFKKVGQWLKNAFN